MFLEIAEEDHMCCPTVPDHPMQCILPPHILDSVRMRGDAKMKKMCDAMTRVSEQARKARLDAAPPHSFRAAPRIAVDTEPSLQREVYDAGSRASLPGTLVRGEGEPPTGDGHLRDFLHGLGFGDQRSTKLVDRLRLGKPLLAQQRIAQ